MARYKIIRPETREKWLEFRKSGIGSSEIGILARVSNFKTPVELYKLKKGLALPEPENDAMKRGHQMEPGVAITFANETGAFIDPNSEGDWLAVSVDKPYMRVSPDRIFWPSDVPVDMRTYFNASILECKTTDLKISRDSYPDSWFFQVQYQMGVMGIKKAVIAWYASYPRLHFDYVEVPFNPVIFAEIENLITDFWVNHIEAGVCPQEAITNEDASFLWPEAVEAFSVADDTIVKACRDYADLSAQESGIKKKLDDIKLKVKTFMQDNGELKTSDGRLLATWKNCTVPDSFDKERFCAENPTLYQQYVKTGQSSRRLTFKKVAASA